ncbi:hypothetical protein C4H11_07145 [Bacteroides zoogleoformans]|uniref:Uncharacterized protein n=1 Tax=Bacteroides zoogleoformans TaxID=28119 RepID=A0ABM6T811_9BACE|nr:hypothetical protein C4H11_07145 [Bacteroides zoogleoformans]
MFLRVTPFFKQFFIYKVFIQALPDGSILQPKRMQGARTDGQQSRMMNKRECSQAVLRHNPYREADGSLNWNNQNNQKTTIQ